MILEPQGQDQIIASQPKKKYWLVSLFALVVLVALIKMLLTTTSNQLSINKDSLQFSWVSQGDLIRDVAATGKIVAANAPQIYSPEQGLINLRVNAGDHVALGQVIATLLSPELINQAKQQRAELARLMGELERQKLNARR